MDERVRGLPAGLGRDFALSTKVICLKIGNEIYGVRIDYVEEIIKLSREKSVLPSALPHLRGIISIRGEIVPIFDLSVMFGISSPIENIEDKKGVVIRLRDGSRVPFCIIADEVFVERFTERALSDSPKIGIKYRDVIEKVAKFPRGDGREEIVIILDPNKIIEKHKELSKEKSPEQTQILESPEQTQIKDY